MQSRYRNRYRYNGNIDIGYSFRISESFVQNPEEGESGLIIDRPKVSSWNLRWSHTQDRKAHPYRSFNASVNFQTQNYDQLNSNRFQDVVRNQYGSNIGFRYNFPNLPLSLSASIQQSSNSATGQMRFTLPDLNIRMRRIFPFERKEAIGKAKWYEQIGVTLDSRFRNQIIAADSSLFEAQFFKNADFGLDNDMAVSASFQVMKYFSLTPSFNFQSTMYWERTFRDFDPNQEFVDVPVIDANGDTTGFISQPTTFGMDTARVVPGFAMLNQYDIGASLNTKVFFTFTKQVGRLKGIRSVVTPSISFRYSPDYEDLGYIRRVQTSLLDEPEDFRTYSLFNGGIFGSGPTQPGEQMSLGYNFSSFLEAKVFSKRDSTDKLVRIINTVTFGGNYNFAADSLNFSQMRLSANAKLFKNISRIQISALWDPYAANDQGRRINRLYFKDTNKPLRFEMAGIRIQNTISVGQLKSVFKGEGLQNSSSSRNNRQKRNESEGQPIESSLSDIFNSFRIRHDLVYAWDRDASTGRTDSEVTTHTISFMGSLPLTDKWAVNVGNFTYDLKRKQISYPVFGFQRNLHCWSLDFNWAPLRNTFSLNLRVLQNPLDFLKIPFQRNNQDTFFN